MPKESKKPNLLPIHSLEKENFKMAWMRDFREMLRANPGIIKTAIDLANKATEEYNPANFRIGAEGIELEYDKESSQWLVEKYTQEKDASGEWQQVPGMKVEMDFGRGTILAPNKAIVDERTGLIITILGRSSRKFVRWFETRIDKCDYFKITFQGKSFFVKRSFISNNPGFIEFKNTVSADTTISFDDYGKLKERPSIETREFYLGFENKEKYNTAKERSILIRQKLKSIGLDYDLGANLFYSHKTETFILLDVTGGNEDYTLGKVIDII